MTLRTLLPLLTPLAFALGAGSPALARDSTDCQVTSGIFTDENGDRIRDITSQDGEPDVVTLVPEDYEVLETPGIVITDENYVILSILGDATAFDFDNAAGGMYNLFLLTYRGELKDGAQLAGESVYEAKFTDDCWLISKNELILNVTAATPDACEVTTGIFTDQNGDRILDITSMDGEADSVTLVPQDYEIKEQAAFVVTDENYVIETIYADTLTWDLDYLDGGQYNIFLLTYTGTLAAGDSLAGQSVYEAKYTEDCWLISANELIVNVTAAETECQVTSGIFTDENGDRIRTIFVGDGQADSITLVPEDYEVLETPGVIVTDEDYVIVDIVANTYSIDFDAYPAGKYNLFLLTYTGTLAAGDSLAGQSVYEAKYTDACWLISKNELILFAEGDCRVTSGIFTNQDGERIDSVAVGDGTPDSITLVPQDYEVFENPAVVVTDEDYVIISITTGMSIDLDSFPAGKYNLFLLTYTGALATGDALAGQSVYEAQYTDDCWLISKNELIVFATGDATPEEESDDCEAVAGTMTADATAVTVADGGEVDLEATLASEPTVPAGFTSAFVLTSGADLVIENVGFEPTFTVSDTGTYRIHNVVANLDADTEGALDLSVVQPGVTTAGEVLDLVAAADLCVALDVEGVAFEVSAADSIDGAGVVFTAYQTAADADVSVNLDVTAPAVTTVEVLLADAYGRVVSRRSVPATPGVSTVNLPVAGSGSGTYVVSVRSNKGISSEQVLVND